MDIILISAEVIGSGLFLLSLLAHARRGWQSLSNWLILAAVYDVFVCWGLVTRWAELFQQDTDFRTTVAVWFLWQPVFWLLWVIGNRKVSTEAGRDDEENHSF